MGYLSRILGRIYFRTGAHSGAIEINWSLMKFFASIVVSYFFFFFSSHFLNGGVLF